MSSLLEKMILEDIDWLTNDLVDEGKRLKEELGKLLYNFEAFVETGDLTYLHKELGIESSVEEKAGPTIPKRKGRPKRGVLAEINDTNIPSDVDHIRIKTEKTSNGCYNQNNLTQISQKGSEITENSNQEDMPPPSQILPKKRKIKKEPLDGPAKRSTRTKRKPERYTCDEPSIGKESDVIIQNPEIVTIDVSNDSENTGISNIPKQQDEPVRSKRTRTIKKKDAEPNVNEYVVPVNEEKTIPTVQPTNFNATYTANSNSTFINNCTVVLEKMNLSEHMEIVSEQTPEKTQKNKKEIFSPFDKVSTKKKVEAFEKLVISTSSPAPDKNVPDKNNKEENKHMTPMTSKIPSKTNSTTKVNKFAHRENSCDKSNLISTKSQSALKASQAEFRERLKKKQEKEEEALRKREAMLLALTEEKRKKREEKQLKAQQQRELIEKEKLKQLELQKLREEKYKQALAEKEEKIQQQKEEARKKAEEIKLKEKNPKLSGRPIYMITTAPLLPTDDCYDSDEEGTSKDQKIEVPSWSKDRELYKMQYLMIKAGETLKNTFFCRQIHTPNLQEIFEEIDPRKLKRTSSAIWRKPPRYTIFLESSTIQFSEDDEN